MNVSVVIGIASVIILWRNFFDFWSIVREIWKRKNPSKKKEDDICLEEIDKDCSIGTVDIMRGSSRHENDKSDDKNYVPPTMEELLEKVPDGEQLIHQFRSKLRKTFRRSKLLDEDHEILFPRFEIQEIQKGEILGKGGFGTVNAVSKFRIQQFHHINNNNNAHNTAENLAAFSFRSWAGEDDTPKASFRAAHQHRMNGTSRIEEGEEEEEEEETPLDEAYYEGQFQDKRFIAENAMTMDTKKARYVVKYISSDIVLHNFSKFVQAATDLAIETHFLSILNHPHILKMRGVGIGDFFCPTYFLLLDRLYDTLNERIISWDNNIRKCDTSFFAFIRLLSSPQRRDKTKHQILQERLTVARDIADALSYLHELRIIYRDLKPENIGFDVRGVVKVFDFGLAKELHEEDKLRNGTYKLTPYTGSLRYMAPEVCNKWPYNFRADVHSFGILLWEIMALKVPFEHHCRDTMIDMVINWGERPPLDQKNWSTNIQSLMTLCWDPNHRNRPSMKEVVKQLQQEIDAI